MQEAGAAQGPYFPVTVKFDYTGRLRSSWDVPKELYQLCGMH